MEIEEKIKTLEIMFQQEKSIYKKVYILAFIQKFQKKYKSLKRKKGIKYSF